MNTHSLKHELSSHILFRERLREAYPEADDDTLKDTLEGLTNLQEILVEVLRSVLADEDFVEALRKRIWEMNTRCQRLAERARKKRELVCEVMADAEIKRLEEPDFTVSLRSGRRALEVLDEERIPQDYWKEQPPKLDRLGLAAALAAGRIIEGARLSDPATSIAVRTK
jgi:hypothetical protein